VISLFSGCPNVSICHIDVEIPTWRFPSSLVVVLIEEFGYDLDSDGGID
jgi:hypothetical protein